MTPESARETAAEPACPFCAFWTAWKKSDAAQHVHAIERESLLLVRSLLESCIRAAEGEAARRAPGTEQQPRSH